MLDSAMNSASSPSLKAAVGYPRRIRSLFIITALQTGGAEMMLYKLLAGMDRRRFDPSVICLGDSGMPGARIRELGIPVCAAGMSPTRPSPISLWRVCRWARDVRPDILQGWMYHGNAAATLAEYLSLRGVPVLWSVRATVYSLKHERARTAALIRLSAALSRRALRIIYASRVSADQHETLGFAANRTTIIPNGFDCEQFKPLPHARSAVRRQLNVGEDAILIGLINRFHPMKDHASFLAAAALISRMSQRIHFVLAGQGVDLENPILADLSDRLHLRGRVHFLGERDNIAELMAGLDVVTSSSAFAESFPNVIGEGMACGVPCVVTDIGHSATIVGDTGLVVPPRNPAALAAAWSRLVDMGAEARTMMGAAARQRILGNFSLDKVVGQYEALYDKVLQDRLVDA